MYPSVGWLGRYGSQALIINLDRETVCYWITRFRFTLWRRNRRGNRPISHCSCTSPPRVDHPVHNNKTAALMSLHWLLSPQIFVFFFFTFYIRVYVCVHKELIIRVSANDTSHRVRQPAVANYVSQIPRNRNINYTFFPLFI